MRPRSRKWARCRSLLVAALCLTGSRAPAQQQCLPPRPPQYYFPPPGYAPCMPAPFAPAAPSAPAAPAPGAAERPSTGAPAPVPPGGTGAQQGTAAPAPTGDMGAGGAGADTGAAFAGLGSGAGVGSSVALAAPGGYLDNPVPINTFRIRYDLAYGLNRPDRAEYFYAAWQELGFHPHGQNHGGAFFDPQARGPEQLPANVNVQEPSAYLEWAFNKRLSAFVDVPLRYLDFTRLQEDNPESEQKRNPADGPNPGSPFFPEPGPENPNSTTNNPGGLSDIRFGIKAALIAEPDQYLTFQFRTYSPTGSVSHGLGTGHWSVEPGLLWYHLLGENAFLQAELVDWVPLTSDPVAGNVLNYGVGFGYQVYRSENLRVVPITEVVGWTVLHGFESTFGAIDATPPAPNFELPLTHGVEDASGATIVNVKLGARFYFGSNNSFFGPGNSLYLGYGRAVTGSHWYQDIFRAEYRLTF